MQGDENQAERHLNSAFKGHSGAAPYYGIVIELQALSNAYYNAGQDYVAVRIYYFRNFQERK